jgi:hypothetical protein
MLFSSMSPAASDATSWTYPTTSSPSVAASTRPWPTDASSRSCESSANSNRLRSAERGPVRQPMCTSPAAGGQRAGTSTTLKPSGSWKVSPCSAQYGLGGATGSASSRSATKPTASAVSEIEDDPVRPRRHVRAARGQLEVRSRPRQREEHAVVALVSAELADLGQPDPVAVDRDDVLQPIGVPSNADLHVPAMMTR